MPVIGIYILPKQCYLPVSHFEQLLYLLQNRSGVPASFSSTHIGNYAICAHVIATPHYRYKRSNTVHIHSHMRNISVGLFPREQNILCFVACRGFSKKSREFAISSRPHY